MRLRTRLLALASLSLAAIVVLPTQPALAASTFSGYYTNSYGTRYYEGYVPSSYVPGSPAPLVVALHGCTQTTGDFAAGSRLNQQAESKGFIVLYVQQSAYANSALCWNWFTWSNQFRGAGEPSLIAGITSLVRSNFSVNPKRIHVTGVSAGASMAVVMGATYPDVFASIAVHAGCEYNGYPCGSSGGPNPTTSGNDAYSAMGTYKRVVPVQVWHGTADTTVYPINGSQVVSQWAQTDDLAYDGIDNNDIDDVADATTTGQVSGGRSFTTYDYRGPGGSTVLQKVLVNGMGHAYSGGSSAGSYTDPSGPDATKLSWDFFVAHPKP